MSQPNPCISTDELFLLAVGKVDEMGEIGRPVRSELGELNELARIRESCENHCTILIDESGSGN